MINSPRLVILLMTLSIQVIVTHSERNFDGHVQKQILDALKNPGSSTTRICEMYSKITGKHVQIIGRKVNANGVSGGKYAKLEISSISFNGIMTIKGVATGRYLCMTKKGRLIGRKKRSTKRCAFQEDFGTNYFDTYRFLARPEWYVAFQRNGKPKRGPKTTKGKNEMLFLKRNIEDPIMTTVSPSAVGKDVWTRMNNMYRAKYMATRDLELDSEVLLSTLMGDDPGAGSLTTVPPDIRKEIEVRKYLSRQLNLTIVPSVNQFKEDFNLMKQLKKQKKHSKKSKRRDKKKNRKKRKHRTRDQLEKTTQSIIQDNFSLTPPLQKKLKRKKTTLTTATEATVYPAKTKPTFTIPSLLQINLTGQPRKGRRKTNRKKSKVRQRFQNSRNRKKSSHRRKKARDVT